MAKVATTFPQGGEFEKAKRALDELGLAYDVISPEPGYARVGLPSLTVDSETRMALAPRDHEFVCSGWVDYRPAAVRVPEEPAPDFGKDLFGRAAIMFLGACVARHAEAPVLLVPMPRQD